VSARLSADPALTRALVKQGLLAGQPFILADVGASGGIARHWRQFEPALKAYGFDPLVRECERLNALERNPEVRYYDCFMGDEQFVDPPQGWSNQPFERTSAAWAQRLDAVPSAQVYNHGNPRIVYTHKRTSLAAFFRDAGEPTVDFIKVDTDGQDYEVLCGAKELIDPPHALGVLVEAQFHGVSHPHANLFANIDRLLRERGFSLFDLTPYRYTRAALPGRFVVSYPSDTAEGQLLAADALYLRDVAAPGYDARWGSLSRSKLLKLLCLFELHGLPDCAAELLQVKQAEFAGTLDRDAALDALARQADPQLGSFAARGGRFTASREAFYPRSLRERLKRRLPHAARELLASIRQLLQR
jgi:FkbM family methyltransferase